MAYTEQPLGQRVMFLLPSWKLKNPSAEGGPPEEKVHRFLMENFGGYTAAAGNIFGYWEGPAGEHSYGEHRQFTVALTGTDNVEVLKSFLASMALELGEESIYLEVGRRACLLYPAADR